MLKILKNLTRRDWALVLLAALLIVAQVWLDLTMPDYMSKITLLVQTPGSAMSEVLAAGGMMILCALGSLCASVLTIICAARIGSSFSATLRARLFDRVQSFSMEEIGRFSTASLITRSTNDVTQVQMLVVMGLEMLFKAPLKAAWAIAKISGKEWHWTLATGVAVCFLLFVVVLCVSLTMPKFKKLQSLTDSINRITRESLNGLRVVRAYNAGDYQEQKFAAANRELSGTHLFTQRVMSFMSPSIQLVMSGLTLAVYWIGAVLISSAGPADKLVLFSEMMVFSQYAIQTVMSFMMLVMIFMILPRASVSIRRINEVLDTEPTILNGNALEGKEGLAGQVEFRHVSFRYPDAEEYVLHDINFTAYQGETVAFIGSTGCGKSTVINLIPRFYDVTEGEVLVNGVNVKDYDQKALRNKIGYISQKATLFSGSIRSNVAYGSNGREQSSPQAAEQAVAVAQAEEFVSQLTDKLDSHVAQGGSNLSGGQKQRLSIARAVHRDPEIFIFDDAFSALDYQTDRKLRQALKEHCAGATRLIVAQRIGTIRDADRIIVLDDGNMVGIGTHEELMESCEVYRQIAYSQLSREELA